MRAFIAYPKKDAVTKEELWYYENENGATVGPFESEESANGAAKEGYKAYRASRDPKGSADSGPGM